MVNSFSFIEIRVIIIIAFSIEPSKVIVIAMTIVITVFKLNSRFHPWLTYIFLITLPFLLTISMLFY